MDATAAESTVAPTESSTIAKGPVANPRVALGGDEVSTRIEEAHETFTQTIHKMPHQLTVVKTVKGFKIRGASGKLLKKLYATKQSAQAVIRGKYKKSRYK